MAEGIRSKTEKDNLGATSSEGEGGKKDKPHTRKELENLLLELEV